MIDDVTIGIRALKSIRAVYCKTLTVHYYAMYLALRSFWIISLIFFRDTFTVEWTCVRHPVTIQTPWPKVRLKAALA